MTDYKDKLILYYLLIDSRIKESVLAKKVKLSKQAVNTRIRKLEKKNYIKRYRISIDYSKFGKIRYSFLIKLKEGENTEKNITKIKSLPKVSVILDCIGKWDIYISIWIKNPSEIDDISRQIFNIIKSKEHTILQTIYSETMFGRIIAPIEIIEEKSDIKGNIPLQTFKYDQTSEKIINNLNKNSKMPITKLSEKSNLPLHIIKYKLKQLKSNKILQRCFAILNMEKLGYQEYTCLCKLNLTKQIELKKLINQIKKDRAFSFYMRCIGEWDLYFSIFANNPQEFRKKIEKIILKYKGLIKDYETFIIHQLH